MTDITGALKKITTEETKAAASVSQATLQRIGGTLNYLIDNSSTALGDVIPSALGQTQFQQIRGNNWVKFNGQDITGSDFAILTGITTLPLQYDGGSLIQAAGTIDILDTDAGQNIYHNHGLKSTDSIGGDYGNGISADTQCRDTFNDFGNMAAEGGSINRAGGIRLNFYIKIENEPS